MQTAEQAYVYGFTAKDVSDYKPMRFEHHFVEVAAAGRREQEVRLRQLATQPKPRPEPRLVKMKAFRVDKDSPKSLATLREKFPGHDAFFLVNRTVHEMFRKSDAFDFVGTLAGSYSTETPKKGLSEEFLAIPDGSNEHLWAV